jgi:hypothetical protein
MLTLSTFQLNPQTTLRESGLEMRLWYNPGFLDVNDETVQAGNGSTGFYIPFTCTVASSIVTVQGTDIFTTLDANVQSPQSIQVFARLFSNGSPKDWVFTGWVIPSEAAYPGGSITLAQLTIYNEGANTLANPPTTYLTAAETAALISASIGATSYASSTHLGSTYLDIDPIVSTHPEALGSNSYASTSHLGISKLDTAPVASTSPEVVGSNSPLVTFQLNATHFKYSGTWYGLVGDGTTESPSTLSALNSAIAAASSYGVVVYFPSGVYDLGNASTTSRIIIHRSNIVIKGDGIGRTVIKYNSGTHTGSGEGECFQVGDNISTYENISFFDLSIEDKATSFSGGFGHNPSAIDAILVNNLRVEGCEFINIKTSAITNAGTAVSSEPANRYFYVRDCIIRGDSVGGWIETDGINFGWIRDVFISGNRIEGVNSHGIEGGGKEVNVHITDNVIDMKDRGENGITSAFGESIFITNNYILGVASTRIGINIACEPNTVVVENVHITNNVIESTHAGAIGISVQEVGGIDDLYIQDNKIKAGSAIRMFNNGRTVITNNIFDLLGSNTAFGGNPDAIPAGKFVIVKNNHIVNTGGSPKVMVFVPGQFSNWKQIELKLSDNDFNGTIVSTGQIDGATQGQATAGSLSANTASAEFTTTVLGTVVGDEVEIVPGVTWDTGLVAVGKVTAADTVSWRIFNPTSGAISIPAFPNNFVSIWITRR